MVVLMARRLPRLVFLTAIGAAWLAPPAPLAAQSAPPRVVRIMAERFTFSPSQVRVPRGTRIEFRLSSGDTNHGFRIIGTRVNVIVPKRGRGEITVTFEATEPGRYVFECSKPCGAGHSIMRGEIVVE
jgi:heme/copper-type cytochrome/quinol oxidase subunit 2